MGISSACFYFFWYINGNMPIRYPTSKMCLWSFKFLVVLSDEIKFLVADKVLVTTNLTTAYIKILYYDRIDVSKGIDVNKSNK